jgi:hypothetical protein
MIPVDVAMGLLVVGATAMMVTMVITVGAAAWWCCRWHG